MRENLTTEYDRDEITAVACMQKALPRNCRQDEGDCLCDDVWFARHRDDGGSGFLDAP